MAAVPSTTSSRCWERFRAPRSEPATSPRKQASGTAPAVPERPLRGQPVHAGLPDALHLLLVQEADAPADHAEHAAGDERPRLGVGVAGGMQHAFLLAAANHVGMKVVDLAHMAAEVLAELGIL